MGTYYNEVSVNPKSEFQLDKTDYVVTYLHTDIPEGMHNVDTKKTRVYAVILFKEI